MLGLFSIVPLSIAVPATALGFVFDTFGARFILREHVHWKRWVGVACVTAGVILAVHSGPPTAKGAPRTTTAVAQTTAAHPIPAADGHRSRSARGHVADSDAASAMLP
jgi:drug/metabolite transporter (DMT)-like permease